MSMEYCVKVFQAEKLNETLKRIYRIMFAKSLYKDDEHYCFVKNIYFITSIFDNSVIYYLYSDEFDAILINGLVINFFNENLIEDNKIFGRKP